MRCPYCGGLNAERAGFCVHCGREIKPITNQPPQRPQGQQPPYSPVRPGQPAQGNPVTRQQSPYSPHRPVPPTQGRPGPAISQQAPPTRQASVPVPPPVPEAPAPFPPRTIDQLQMLEQGALPYTVVDTTASGEHKKIVRIVYPKCIAWQQVATLLKAFKEQQETRFETILVQGYLSSDADELTFTNGQLTFDRDVRLGSQVMKRYQIETGNGFESDSVRIVLSE